MTTQAIEEQRFLEECENFNYSAMINTTLPSNISEQKEIREQEEARSSKKVYGVQGNVSFYTNLDKHNYARMSMMMAEERGETLSYEEALKVYL